nr:ribonuclease H-like domain-containing protein [Tanacetum cinerariifolium]
MSDLGSLNYFLDISAQRSKSGLFLSQSKFSEEILEWAHMQHCNPCKTPVDTEYKLGSDGDPHICLYMHDPRDPHFTALKHVDRRHVTLSRSSAEAEYLGVANVVAETAWIQNLLLELHASLTTATLVYCDNISAVYLSTNPVQHQCTKHIEIDIHFVRDCVASGQRKVVKISFKLFKNSDQNFHFLPLLLSSSNTNPTHPPPTTTSSQPPPPSHPSAATIQATGNPHPAVDHHYPSRRLHHLSRHKRSG